MFYIRALIVTIVYVLCSLKWGFDTMTPYLFAYFVLQEMSIYFINWYRKKKHE